MVRTLLLAISVTLFFALPSEAKPTNSPTSAQQFETESRYLALFNSAEEYLGQMQSIGFLNESEKTAIEKFMSKHKLNKSAELTAPTFVKGEVKWNSYGLTVMEDGRLKTKSGQFLNFSKSAGLDDVFAKTYLALTDHSSASIFPRLIVPDAFALDDSSGGAASGALAATGWWAGHLAGTAIEVLIGPLCTVPMISADFVKYEIQWWKHDGKVGCAADGRYVMINYPRYADFIKDNYNLRKDHTHWDGMGVSGKIDGAVSATCAGPMMDLFAERPGASPQDVDGDSYDRPVNYDVVAKALKGSSYEGMSCSEKSAAVVNTYIQDQVKKASATLHLQAKAPRTPGQGSDGNK